MGVSVHLSDHSESVKAQIRANATRAAQAVGIEAVGLTVKQMQGGYGKPIRQTGNLMRDVNYETESSGTKTVVRIGNSLFYAPLVHEGTSRMSGRPYLKDAIQSNLNRLLAVWQEYLGSGF